MTKPIHHPPSSPMIWPVAIIGGGPAGLSAAIAAAEAGAKVVVIEAGPSCGRKLLITGGGRCNLTHEDAPAELLKSFGPDRHFMRPATWEFPPEAVRQFFADHGLPTKVEADGCVFPDGGEAPDVLAVLMKEVTRLGVAIHYKRRVVSVGRTDDGFIVRTSDAAYHVRHLIIATGGVSYPTTGSQGDGYEFARALGHMVTPVRSAVAPLETERRWPGELAGVSVGNVLLTTHLNERKISCRGDLMFTHWGIGGPAVLKLSWRMAEAFTGGFKGIDVLVDFFPDEDRQSVEARLRRLIEKNPKRKPAGLLHEMGLPWALAEILCREHLSSGDCIGAELAREERNKIIELLKRLVLKVTGARPAIHAVAVRGGVATAEIDPRTMESRIVPGLFFAGEVIDVDGDCGGYNLQIAWSTGRLAGLNAAFGMR